MKYSAKERIYFGVLAIIILVVGWYANKWWWQFRMENW